MVIIIYQNPPQKAIVLHNKIPTVSTTPITSPRSSVQLKVWHSIRFLCVNKRRILRAYDQDYISDLLRVENVLYTENNRDIHELLNAQGREVPESQATNVSMDRIAHPNQKINTPEKNLPTDSTPTTPPSVLAYHLFLPRFFAALRALHIASPAKMRGKIHALKGWDIFVSAFFAPVISRDLLDF